MSSFDPLAALGLDAVAAAQQAIAEATINLGVSSDVLQAQVSVGDVIPATILTPVGGNDLLSFLGQTVIAALPQGVYPGETLALQVTGFSGNQILVRNLGVTDPDNLPAPVALEPQAGTPASAVLQSEAPPSPQAAAAAPASSKASPADPVPLRIPMQQGASPPPAAPASPVAPPPPAGLAPPASVFVAAALRAGSPPPPPANVPAAAQTTAIPAQPVQAAIEARIATARATSADAGTRSGSVPEAEQGTTSATTDAAASVQARITPPDDGGRPVIVMRAPGTAVLPPAARSAEETLLARLRIPLTPATLAAARIVGDGARSIPRAFGDLERALAGVPMGDARVPSLRALMGFSGRIDLSNTRALAEQLASFVSNVLDGRESKFAAIVRAAIARGPASETPPAPQTSEQGSAMSGARSALAQPEPPVAQPLPPATQAQVAERAAALEFDVKSAVMALVQTPPAGSPPGLPAALGNALNAITALQMNVLNAQQNDPNSILVPLPVFYRDGGAPAQLRIARDGGNGKQLDGDTFHVAFVLDTKTLGTVAIDLQSAGRAVSISVKTERSGSAQRFRSSLDDLRSRLEHLRYRVAAIAADVAPVRSSQETAPEPAETTGEPPLGQLDLRA
ncbi:MAG: flagellar hook-length control protein FliK [Vulcanimicrobiaceae bacterium]